MEIVIVIAMRLSMVMERMTKTTKLIRVMDQIHLINSKMEIQAKIRMEIKSMVMIRINKRQMAVKQNQILIKITLTKVIKNQIQISRMAKIITQDPKIQSLLIRQINKIQMMALRQQSIIMMIKMENKVKVRVMNKMTVIPLT